MLRKISIAFALLFCLSAHASVVVIGSPDINIDLGVKEIKKLYLGKKVAANNVDLTAIELDPSLPQKAEFHRAVTNKSLVQLESYWSKQLFTGKGKPPKSLASQQEVLEKVKNGHHVVGYVEETVASDDVKILLKF